MYMRGAQPVTLVNFLYHLEETVLWYTLPLPYPSCRSFNTYYVELIYIGSVKPTVPLSFPVAGSQEEPFLGAPPRSQR